MDGIPWDPSLETGDPTIDHQHRTLFALVNKLRDAAVGGHANQAVGAVLDELATYVATHFGEEQRLMARTGYPIDEIMAHTHAHTTLTARTAELIEQHKAGSLTTVLPVAEFLFDWLRTHIRQADKRLVEHVRARGEATA